MKVRVGKKNSILGEKRVDNGTMLVNMDQNKSYLHVQKACLVSWKVKTTHIWETCFRSSTQ
jgi:hypothetical protein